MKIILVGGGKVGSALCRSLVAEKARCFAD